jgi:probable blue pigment (indigoidine) exporter
VTHLPDPGGPMYRLAPVVLGACAFSCGDVLVKVALIEGADVLTMATVRGVIGVAFLAAWLPLGAPRAPITPRAKWISAGLGVLFAGNVFWLFKAIEAIEVPVAILTYFVYPLLTGLAAAATGLERLTWRGALAALAAFLGLALMLGAHPAGLAAIGIVGALAAACCRVTMLLITRAALQDTDARLITWYSLLASTAVFIALSLAAWNWQPPATVLGWVAFVGLGIATTLGVLGVFASTGRIGPFRTALFMNLEPPLTALGSALFLGEVLTPLQTLGGAVMIGALVAFQVRR